MTTSTTALRTPPEPLASPPAPTFICADCRNVLSMRGRYGPGYGNLPEGKICYACCADRDREHMRREGQIVLYWNGGNMVTNWPETLEIIIQRKQLGQHNWGLPRYDVWFAFDSRVWHGVQIGDNTQVVHCKRTKTRG